MVVLATSQFIRSNFSLGELPKLHFQGTFRGVDCFYEVLAKLVIRIIFSKSTPADLLFFA